MPGMKVAIVGGGWAGLGAAIDATCAGHAVTLYEMAAHWAAAPGGSTRTAWRSTTVSTSSSARTGRRCG